jgi:hypothetical protein
MPTLYQPNLNLEQVQAMVLVSGWSDNGWLVGGHAVRMALQLCEIFIATFLGRWALTYVRSATSCVAKIKETDQNEKASACRT